MIARPLAHAWTLVVAAALALALSPRATGAEPMPAAGGNEHGFFLWPPPSGSSPRARHICLIRHIPGAAPLGAVRPGRQILGWPQHLASWGDRLIMVHEPPSDAELEALAKAGADGQQDAATLRAGPPVRRVEAVSVAPAAIGSEFYEFRPVARDPEALPALPAEGALLDVALTGRSAFALLARDGDQPPRLLRLEGSAWVDVPTPPVAPGSSPTMAVVNGGLLLAERRAEDGAPPRVWVAPAEGDPTVWAAAPWAAPAPDERLIVAGDMLIGWKRPRAGPDADAVFLRLFRASGGAHSLATVRGVGADFAVVPVADRVHVVWFESTSAGPRIRTTIVSGVTGETLISGPATQGALVSGRSLLTLALLLGAALLTALVFILRPEPADSQMIAMPPGYALASPGRRLVAAVIDLGTPALIVSRAFDVPMGEILSASMLSPDAGLRGAAALLALLLFALVHATIGEWRMGSTLGKSLVGCRTAAIAGGRPRLWQALVRNLLKLFCPPLALFLLIDARARHPADVLARTIVLVKVRPLPGEPPDRSDPGNAASGETPTNRPARDQ